MSKRLAFCLTLLCAAFGGFAPGERQAFAEEAPADVADAGEHKALHWRCWYNQQAHIHCLLDSAAAEQSAGGQPTATNLPRIVGEMRQRPSSFKSVLVRIPTYSEPIDASFASTLAQAIMCGSRADCSVRYTSRIPHHQEIAVILHRHLGWPTEHGGRPAVAAPRIASVAGGN